MVLEVTMNVQSDNRIGKFTLYMHVVPNGKRYIGMTCRSPKKRWNRGSGYSTNYEFHADIKKYGWDNIKHEILLSGVSQEVAEKWKVYMIERYNTTDPKRGYNYSKGGKYHGEVSDRTREKLRKRANPANKVECICLESGVKYQSLAEAARRTQTLVGGVLESCKSNGVKSTKGRHFIYADPKRREIALTNEVLKDEYWEWEW